jgi:pimeloyl-ACP methyl ester carboxylesterase
MWREMRRSWTGSVLVSSLLLGSCATEPDQSSDALAASHGLTREVVSGRGFDHLIYRRPALPAGTDEPRGIHVYLEGDGRPWETRHRIASDPTPSKPLALKLMLQDPAPVMYVGRPCYQGFAHAEGCRPALWTRDRYGPEVVQSMVSAIDRTLPPSERPPITLIGYSGGGVLAMLIAERLEGVDQVITVAANLDIDAWTDHHGYSRLTGSLNPARQTPLDPRIRQIHLSGDRDREVPPWTIERFRAVNPDATFKNISGFDHRCCWIEQWPRIPGEALLPSLR